MDISINISEKQMGLLNECKNLYNKEPQLWKQELSFVLTQALEEYKKN